MKKIICMVMMSMAATAWAAPNTIRFQGRLTDGQGRPIAGPSVNVRFSLHGTATGGSILWQGPVGQTVETNDAGLFSTDVAVPTEVIAAHEELYLQVAVNDGAGLKPLSPRQKLASVPYAMRSEYAVSAATATWVEDNSITTAKIKSASVTTEKLAPDVKQSLIPEGLVAMFADSCPAGWTYFSPLQGRLPLGIGEFEYTGDPQGSWTISGSSIVMAGGHSHTVDAHTHGITHTHNVTRAQPGLLNVGSIDFGASGPTSGPSVTTSGPASPGTDVQGRHTHEIGFDGTWRPPYVGVIFCRKN